MTPTLGFTYRQDKDGEGYLRARLVSESVSGDFEWFVDYLEQHVLVPFEQQLCAYPISATDPPLLELYSGHSPGLRIMITPVGMTGQLTLALRMDEEDVHILQTSRPITYGTVQRLQAGLRQVIDNGHGSFEIALA